MKNIVLTGMSGAGKSTVGKLLSEKLNMAFIDTDDCIRQYAGKTLQDILDQDGIDRFLEIEETVVSALSASNTVIATGGSVIYSERAMTALKKNGVIVYLYLPFDVLAKRIPDTSSRGIVMRHGSTLHDVYNERMPLYKKYCDIFIDRTASSKAKSAQAIIAAVSSLFYHGQAEDRQEAQ